MIAVHVLQQEHLGEQVLILGARLQLAHRLVPIWSRSPRGIAFLYSSMRCRMNS